jgi:hypothetical protein
MEGHCVQVQRAQDEPGPRVGPEGADFSGRRSPRSITSRIRDASVGGSSTQLPRGRAESAGTAILGSLTTVVSQEKLQFFSE